MLHTQVAASLDDLDTHAKDMLKAILYGRDIFQCSVSDQSVLIRESFADTQPCDSYRSK
jgi:hypothetical protein